MFLDHTNKDNLVLPLELKNEEVAMMAQLLQTIFSKIKKLEFPDISGYEKSMYGIQSFTDDLLSGRT